MIDGLIVKALSGFYYVDTAEGQLECRARGRFRLDGTSPLVGDKVSCSSDGEGKGRIDHVEPRRNWFVRPAVANIDAMVFIAANTNPITDPFLVDRVSVLAAQADCELILVLNKTDIDPALELKEIYDQVGITVVTASAETGEGMDELLSAIKGKVCAFTGNSGVGKSSLLNRLLPNANIPTGQVSQKLGRGKHTTRHVELYRIAEDSYVADTPGFASFDVEMVKPIPKEELQKLFVEFRPYIGECRFNDCAHLKEPGCAVTRAVEEGLIHPSRYRSYQRLYQLSAQHKSWELEK